MISVSLKMDQLMPSSRSQYMRAFLWFQKEYQGPLGPWSCLDNPMMEAHGTDPTLHQ